MLAVAHIGRNYALIFNHLIGCNLYGLKHLICTVLCCLSGLKVQLPFHCNVTLTTLYKQMTLFQRVVLMRLTSYYI